MATIRSISPDTATGRAKELLDIVVKKTGRAPQMMQALANSPAALEGYLNFSAALSEGALGKKVAEQIALAVSELSGCNYCIAAHAAIGSSAGLTPAEIELARNGRSNDRKTNHLLKLATALVHNRGKIPEQQVASLKDAGISEGEITEVVALVGLHLFTNYFNHVAKTDIDFPPVLPIQKEHSCSCC